jgi:hypothetical protein
MTEKFTYSDMIFRHARTVIISDDDKYMEPQNLFEAVSFVLAEVLIKSDTKFITDNRESVISKMHELSNSPEKLEKYQNSPASYALMLSLMDEKYLIARTIFSFYLAIVMKINLNESLDYTELVPKILAQTYLNTKIDETQFQDSYKSGLELMKSIVNNSKQGNESLHQEILENVSNGMDLYLKNRAYEEAVALFGNSIDSIFLWIEKDKS